MAEGVRGNMMTHNDEQPTAQLNVDQLSASAVRMRRLRERRRSAIRIVPLEITAADMVYLRLKGFIHDGECARIHLAEAVQRLLRSIR
jgi:hypothetical protein